LRQAAAPSSKCALQYIPHHEQQLSRSTYAIHGMIIKHFRRSSIWSAESETSDSGILDRKKSDWGMLDCRVSDRGISIPVPESAYSSSVQ
jgi:hypothetical protein